MVALTKVAGDLRWGEPCLAYNVEARFSGSALDRLTATRAGLLDVFPETLNVSPPDALHVSIYSLVPVSWEDAAKESHWQKIQAAALTVVADECANQQPFVLQFSSWRVTTSAIIALAQDASGLIHRLRERLTVIARHELLPAPSYEFIHCTLARFARPAELLSGAAETFARSPLELEVEVHRVRVVRERVYPSLEVEVVLSVELG